MRVALLLAAHVPAIMAVGAAYTSVGAGACRGNGGATDMVNSRYKTGVSTESACEAFCDAEATCAGFAWESSGDNMCILYGPGMSGECASPYAAQTNNGPTVCGAQGSCSAPTTATSEITCGTCSVGSSVRSE